MIRCKTCGRFVAVKSVTVNYLGDIVHVTAHCSKCCSLIMDDEIIWTDYDELVDEDAMYEFGAFEDVQDEN